MYSSFPDLSEVTFSQGCDHRYGNRNCFYDNCRMFYQCIPSASGIRCCIPYADRRTGCHGNRSQQSYQQSSDFCFTLSVAPFNLLKGFLVSLIVFLIYKKDQPDFTNGTRIDYNFTKQQKGFVMNLFFYETKNREKSAQAGILLSVEFLLIIKYRFFLHILVFPDLQSVPLHGQSLHSCPLPVLQSVHPLQLQLPEG